MTELRRQRKLLEVQLGSGGSPTSPRRRGREDEPCLTQLLSTLRRELQKPSQASFPQQLLAAPLDGLGILLDLLKLVQLCQANTGQKGPSQVIFKRWQISTLKSILMPDTKSQSEPPPSIELSVTSMSCWVASKKLSQPRFFILKLFLSKNITSVYFQVGLERLAHHGSGLFTVSVCVMSNFSKSRVLSLQVVGGKYFLSTWSMVKPLLADPHPHVLPARWTQNGC